MSSKKLNTPVLKSIGKAALRLSKVITDRKRKETYMHGIMLGLLEATVGKMMSQYRTNWGFIDFRHGGNNPVLIELVVRYGGNEHYGSQNIDELRKLCRVPFEKARKRVLLILDVSGQSPTEKKQLRQTYSEVTPGRGRCKPEPVTIIYIHPKEEYTFYWTPQTIVSKHSKGDKASNLH